MKGNPFTRQPTRTAAMKRCAAGWSRRGRDDPASHRRKERRKVFATWICRLNRGWIERLSYFCISADGAIRNVTNAEMPFPIVSRLPSNLMHTQ